MLACLVAATLIASPPNAPRAKNYALRFTDAAHGVKVPDAEVLHIVGDITLEAWVKPEAGIRDDSFKFIISRNYDGNGYALLFIGKHDENRIQFEAGSVAKYFVKEPWVRDKWWHVAGVVSGKRMSIYVNGVKTAEAPNDPPLKDVDAPLWIGTSLWGNFRGCIDEVRIWRVARTPEQIAASKDIYLKGNEPGLAAYWSFDEGKGQFVFDKAKKTKAGMLGSTRSKDAGDPKWVPGAPVRR